MKTVILIHQHYIQHYRVAIYNSLSVALANEGWRLLVVSGGIERSNPHLVGFEFTRIYLSSVMIARQIKQEVPDAVIFFVNLKELYLFPVLAYLKFQNIPTIYWGHGIDLQRKRAIGKNFLYRLEHRAFDAIVLYADWLKAFVHPRHHYKIFVANNTLNVKTLAVPSLPKETVAAKYGIKTELNIICVGRLQKRKRIEDLLEAIIKIADVRQDVGLLLVGPDVDKLLEGFAHPQVYYLGPIYGSEVSELLGFADIFCMPGHVGLSIVDAMHAGLPFITEEVDHAPEIMYLKHGQNGFVVPAGDVDALTAKCLLLLEDGGLREAFSREAKRTVESEASMEKMQEGFISALQFCEGISKRKAVR